MAGGYDNKKRFLPQRATPVGEVHYEDPAVKVELTLWISPPPLSYQVPALAVAWTRQAVFCVWREDQGAWRTGWVEARDVRRL